MFSLVRVACVYKS